LKSLDKKGYFIRSDGSKSNEVQKLGSKRHSEATSNKKVNKGKSAKKSEKKTKEDHPIKLYYFECFGRAEPIRMLFSYAKIPFDDIKYTYPEWE
jgi:hypothetical protein